MLSVSIFFFLPTEQYDAFVKFTHDQLMRRFGEQPASCEYICYCQTLVSHSFSLETKPMQFCICSRQGL